MSLRKKNEKESLDCNSDLLVYRAIKNETFESENITRDRFFVSLSRVQDSPSYEPSQILMAPYGFYSGRPIIGQCTPIRGGIYLSAAPREAIVIDERYGVLEEIFQSLYTYYQGFPDAKKAIRENVLTDIFVLVQERIRFDPDRLYQYLRRKEIKVDQKIALDIIIELGFGAARHQVLLAAYLLERFKNLGMLRGTFRINSESTHPSLEDEQLLYTSSSGYTSLLDPLSNSTINKQEMASKPLAPTANIRASGLDDIVLH